MAASVSLQTPRGGAGSVNYVGDAWAVLITGAAPNQPVSSWGIQNGNSNSPNALPVGVSTDANGNAVVTGVFDASGVGNWVETWFVGSTSIGSIGFQVLSAPVAAATSSSAATAATSTAAADTSGTLGFLSDTLLGFPVWLWAAGGVALLFLVKRK